MEAAVDPTGAERCTVCEERTPQRVHLASERMFGWGGSFRYHECGSCGSLALQDVPADLERFYPPDYYSFEAGSRPRRPGTDLLRRPLMGAALRSSTVATALVSGARALGAGVEPWPQLLGGLGLSIDAAVLDVGCGAGHRLETLRRFGFRNLTGVDAHLPGSVAERSGITLSRLAPGQLSTQFDLVMFHHSFEHMDGPAEVLGAVRRLVRPGGALLIRVPLAGSGAWRTYGVHWVQLDAPRHLFLFTAGGLERLAARAGFTLDRVLYDSTAFQFWGSEQYQEGVPLRPAGSDAAGPRPRCSSDQLRDFSRRARVLNATADGDQAAFLFRPSGTGTVDGAQRVGSVAAPRSL